MYIHQHRQNIDNKIRPALVVLHKNTTYLPCERCSGCLFLEIVLKYARVICALHHKICEIIFTQYTYIVFGDMLR